MLPGAALDDRESILRLLERVEADCAYCLLETIESVCGAGCVHQHLHIVSDYPILARRCLPEFAAALASAQARVARQAMGSAAPIGMSVGAELGATDLFVSTGERVHNSFVYRGVHGGEWLYRCAQDDLELWSLSRSDDREAWSRCEGRLWVELETAQARTHATDPSAGAGGVLFGVGMERCRRVLATEATRAAVLQAPRAEDDAGPLSFADGASALEVACTLLWMLGRYGSRQSGRTSYGSRQSGRTTLELPSHVGAIELIGDIVVHNGEDVRLAGAQQGTEVHVGGRQLRIDRGGALELDHLVLTASIGSSAVSASGVLAISNCTLSDAVAGATVILRFMESLVPAGSLAQPPVHGVAFLSTGGALLYWYSSSAVTASNVRFQNNTARPTGVLHDGRSTAGGGAIGGIGGDLELEAVTVEGCAAIGGFTGLGGAVLGMFTRLRISSSTFRANKVVPYRSPSVDATLGFGTFGGALYSLRSEVTIDSSVFENNAAVNGGAIYAAEGSSISLIASILHGNAARDGTMCAGGKASI